MKAVPLFEAKSRLSELVGRVESGQEVAITRRGKVVARLTAASSGGDDDRRAATQEAIRQLRKLRSKVRLEGNVKTIARDGLD